MTDITLGSIGTDRVICNLLDDRINTNKQQLNNKISYIYISAVIHNAHTPT